MKIALCDDAGNDRAAMERRILQLYPGAKIEQFENGFVLLDFLERNSRNVDVLFLDMKMPHLDGVDTAIEIKQTYPHLPIIAVTRYPGEYAVPAYEFSPVHFLVKPVSCEALKTAFGRVLKNLRPDTELLAVQAKGLTRYFPLDTVYSIQAAGAKVEIITPDDAVETPKTLEYYEHALSNQGFFRIHKNSIINLAYVREVDIEAQDTAIIEKI